MGRTVSATDGFIIVGGLSLTNLLALAGVIFRAGRVVERLDNLREDVNEIRHSMGLGRGKVDRK